MRANEAFLRGAIGLVAALAVLGSGRTAAAHQASVVYANARASGREVLLDVRVAAEDLGEPAGRSTLWVPSADETRERIERIAEYVRRRWTVQNAGARCALVYEGNDLRVRAVSYELELRYRATCARRVDELELRDDLFFDLDVRHRALATVSVHGVTRQRLLTTGARSVAFAQPVSKAATLGQYGRLGLEHIFTGFDHLAFLLALLVVTAARGAREGGKASLGVVTAFTVAHSITLALAATGAITVPVRVVETVIAASIVYVALENVVRRDVGARAVPAFGFGLVHGLGFASALAETGLPARDTWVALAGFNGGVEIGQVAVAALVFPVLLAMRERAWTRAHWAVVLGALSAVGMLLGMFGAGWKWLVALGVIAVGGITPWARREGYERAVRRGLSAGIAAVAAVWVLGRVLGIRGIS